MKYFELFIHLITTYSILTAYIFLYYLFFRKIRQLTSCLLTHLPVIKVIINSPWRALYSPTMVSSFYSIWRREISSVQSILGLITDRTNGRSPSADIVCNLFLFILVVFEALDDSTRQMRLCACSIGFIRIFVCG